jgi:hypothetical protein
MFFALPAPARAQSAAELNAKIAALEASGQVGTKRGR